jgi:hypothetical protein
MQAKYKNKSRNGLIHGHEYVVMFTKPKGQYVYDCHIIFDVTEQEEMDLTINYASELSINNNFKYNGELIINE